MAMISEEAEMSKPPSRIGPLTLPPTPVTTLRKARSSASVTRRQVTPCASKPATILRWTALSVMAASRLWADCTA